MGKHTRHERIEREEAFARACMDDPEMLDQLTGKELGRLGEVLARSFLIDRGYTFEEAGYRCAEGEADLIVLDPDTEEVVLVEVKTRRARGCDRQLFPELAVDERKQRRYARIAARYLMEHFPVFSIRFDVIAVTVRSGLTVDLEHMVGAFAWDGDR